MLSWILESSNDKLGIEKEANREVIYYDDGGIVIGYWWWSKSMFMYGDGSQIVLIVTAMSAECYVWTAMGAEGYYG